MVLLRLTALSKKNITLPVPKDLLGNLEEAVSAAGSLSQIQSLVKDKCLREKAEYETILFLFANSVLAKRGQKNILETKQLSVCMPPTLEAFTVLTYVDKYAVWKQKAEETTEPRATPRYTSVSNNQWSNEGMKMYAALLMMVKVQRNPAPNAEEALTTFETRLLQRWQSESGRKRAEANEEMDFFGTETLNCVMEYSEV